MLAKWQFVSVVLRGDWQPSRDPSCEYLLDRETNVNITNAQERIKCTFQRYTNKQVQQSSNSMSKAPHDQNAKLSKTSPTKTVSPLSCFKKPTQPVTIRSRSTVSLRLELSIMINTVSRHWSGITYQQNLQTPANLTAKYNGLLLLSMMNLPSLTYTSPQVQSSYHPQLTATLLSIQETLILATNCGDTWKTTLMAQHLTNEQATMILIHYTIKTIKDISFGYLEHFH